MAKRDQVGSNETPGLWAVRLTARERRLLEACVAWHARVHSDAEQRREFATLVQVMREARRVRTVA